MAWLYKFLASQSANNDPQIGIADSHIDAALIFASAKSDPVAALVVRLMTQLLARVTSDLVLASGAWGGAYLCGSVASGWHPVADGCLFRSMFERKGAMTAKMKQVPTALIVASEPALLGLTYAER